MRGCPDWCTDYPTVSCSSGSLREVTAATAPGGRVVSGVGEQELHTTFEEAFVISKHNGSARCALEWWRRSHFQRRQDRQAAFATAVD